MHLQRTLRDVRLPEELADTTILVLGLLHMGYEDAAQIADLLHVRDVRSLRRLLRMLETSRNPVVRRCVDFGLPPGLCRPFPYEGAKVLCPVCRSMVDHVPCPKCSIEPSCCAPSPYMQDHPVDRDPTAALPGSREKTDVMQCRAGKSLSLFHPHDRKRCEL